MRKVIFIRIDAEDFFIFTAMKKIATTNQVHCQGNIVGNIEVSEFEDRIEVLFEPLDGLWNLPDAQLNEVDPMLEITEMISPARPANADALVVMVLESLFLNYSELKIHLQVIAETFRHESKAGRFNIIRRSIPEGMRATAYDLASTRTVELPDDFEEEELDQLLS
mgnify:CR=1 FL=1